MPRRMNQPCLRETGNISVSHYNRIPKSLKAVAHRIATWSFRNFGSHRQFRVRGKTYEYFYDYYNNTYAGERCVEIPIVLSMIANCDDANLLEVGNVLRHYTGMTHDVIDKYEHAPGLICCDVLDYRPEKAYQAIVSISTIEHIGWDETVKDATKPARVVEHLRSLLKKNGTLIVSTPTGYNPAVDEGFSSGQFRFDDVIALCRTSFSTWRESTVEEALSHRFGSPYPYGNAVLIGLARKS